MPDHLTLVPLDGVLRSLPGPVIVVGGDVRIVHFNAPALDTLPTLRHGGSLAMSLRDPDVLDAAARVLAGGPCEVVDWRDRVPVERAFQITLCGMDTEAERMIVMSLRDLSAERRIERMRADFIANASHELRTPLASLLGFIETLQGPARDDAPARLRFLAIMAEQARRMARLIDDLLSLSRIEQKLHLKPSHAVDLAALARHVVDTLGPLADEKGATLVLDTADAVMVTGERDELIRVAENLIENALKYGVQPESGEAQSRVEVSVGVTGRDAVLAVRDHGPGIAGRHLPRLTERFYRVDAGQSRAKGGTGLGLALVKHIVARHRGRLSITSVPGDGARFEVAIPVRSKAGDPPREREDPEPRYKTVMGAS